MLITDKSKFGRFAPEQNVWVGIPGIEVTKKGRHFLTFYSGGVREEIGNHVVLKKSEDGVDFSETVAVCFAEGYRCFDPCLWIDPLGRLWFIWSRCPEDGVWAAICEDPDGEEIVFGKEFFIGHNVMMNKPVVLSSGEWIFPLAVWNSDVRTLGPEWDSPVTPKGSFAYATWDNGKTFHALGYADVKRRSFDEHMFLEMQNGALRCFVRTSYGIGAADSYDGGRHWGEDFDTGYGGPSSRFHIRRLSSGRILLINHYQNKGRNNLTALLSEDDGKSFPYSLLLDERRRVSYPDAALAPDGRIVIAYDRERGAFLKSLDEALLCAREILTASVTEEDILAGKIVSDKSYLKRVVYKLGAYRGENPDPYCLSDAEFDRFRKGDRPKDMISRIFDAYHINCTNLHHVKAEELDRLVETYRKKGDLETLERIISLVRKAQAAGETSEDDVVRDVQAYLAENLEKNESVEEIAKKVFFSAHYLRHLFKKKSGVSIQEFKNYQRLKKAKILLCTTNHKILEIAAACGFQNAAYFTEFFVKETGMSPTRYRELRAGAEEKEKKGEKRI